MAEKKLNRECFGGGKLGQWQKNTPPWNAYPILASNITKRNTGNEIVKPAGQLSESWHKHSKGLGTQGASTSHTALTLPETLVSLDIADKSHSFCSQVWIPRWDMQSQRTASSWEFMTSSAANNVIYLQFARLQKFCFLTIFWWSWNVQLLYQAGISYPPWALLFY